MRLRTQCLLVCAGATAALQLQPAPQLIKRPHQQPRVILTTEQVEKLERSVAAALPAVGQWAAFGGVVSAFSGFLWGYAGLPAAGLYASSVASGTAWALAWDHIMPGGLYAASFLYRLHAIDASARWRLLDGVPVTRCQLAGPPRYRRDVSSTHWQHTQVAGASPR